MGKPQRFRTRHCYDLDKWRKQPSPRCDCRTLIQTNGHIGEECNFRASDLMDIFYTKSSNLQWTTGLDIQ